MSYQIETTDNRILPYIFGLRPRSIREARIALARARKRAGLKRNEIKPADIIREDGKRYSNF